MKRRRNECIRERKLMKKKNEKNVQEKWNKRKQEGE